MNETSINTKLIQAWAMRMSEKTGFCPVVLCEGLALYCGESGNESPSNFAVEVALNWEKNISGFVDYVQSRNQWCMKPTAGCFGSGCVKWEELKRWMTDADAAGKE